MPAKKFLIAAVAVLALAGLGFVVLRSGDTTAVVTVSRGTAVQVVYATGVIEAEQQASIAPEVSGHIAERLVEEGAAVTAGQPLLRLNADEQKAAVAEMAAKVINAETVLARAEQLWNRRTGSREDYDNAKAQLEQARGQLAAAQARLAQRTLLAPFDGIVLRREKEVGDMASAGQILFVIGQSQPLRATVEVDEEDFPLVKLGQKVLLSNDAFPGQVFTAAVTELTPLGDASNKTYRVRARLPDGTPLPVGMTLEANIVVAERENVLLLPSAALRGGQAFRPNGKVVDVKTGIRGLEMTEITEGLAEGDELLAVPPASSGH